MEPGTGLEDQLATDLPALATQAAGWRLLAPARDGAGCGG
jgi:hypothetical protein